MNGRPLRTIGQRRSMRESRERLDRERKWHNRVYCKGARIAVVLRMPFSFTARAIAPGLDARDAAICRIEWRAGWGELVSPSRMLK